MPDLRLLTEAYIDEVKDLIGLKDWRVRLEEAPCPPEEDGHIECVPGQRLALIALSENWPSDPPEERRHTVVHELVHCHLHETQACIERSHDLLGGMITTVLSREHLNFVEHAVDAIALVLAPYIPLPPEVPDGRSTPT